MLLFRDQLLGVLVRNEFFPVTTKFICYFKGALPFDVYLERFEGKFTKIYHKDGEHDSSQIDRYENKDIKTLYISQTDKNTYGNFLCKAIDQFNNGSNDLDKEKMIDIIKTTLELTYEKIVDNNNDLDMSITWASHQVRSALYLMGDDTASAIEIFKALSADLHLLKHSYLVSLFSLSLAKKLDFSNERNLMGVGLGALLHDLGHTRMNSELFQKIHLTPGEWEEVKDHPVLGLKILERSKAIPADVRSIILQHHEQPNGRGYPNRLAGNKIFPPAKIVAIAEEFCSLVTMSGPGEPALSPPQAISRMKDDIGHYDPEFLDSFEEMILGIKKPVKAK
jgi:putative nucleotidyltransferase with HDIG domain